MVVFMGSLPFILALEKKKEKTIAMILHTLALRFALFSGHHDDVILGALFFRPLNDAIIIA